MRISSEDISFGLLTPLLLSQLRKKEYTIELEDDVFLKKQLSSPLRLVLERSLEGARSIQVSSSFMKTRLEEQGIVPEKIKISRPRVSQIKAQSQGEKNRLGKGSARNALKLTGKILLSAGSLNAWNGFPILLMSMPELLKRLPFLHLVIFGDGPDREALQTSITNLGLSRKVDLVVSVDESLLGKYMDAADIFILNSKDEGLSKPLLSAVSYRLPIVTTSFGGNTELFEDEKNALLIHPNNSRQIVKSVEKLLLREDVAERLTSFEQKS